MVLLFARPAECAVRSCAVRSICEGDGRITADTLFDATHVRVTRVPSLLLPFRIPSARLKTRDGQEAHFRNRVLHARRHTRVRMGLRPEKNFHHDFREGVSPSAGHRSHSLWHARAQNATRVSRVPGAVTRVPVPHIVETLPSRRRLRSVSPDRVLPEPRAMGDEKDELLGALGAPTERGHNRVRRERVAVAFVGLVLVLCGVFGVLAGTGWSYPLERTGLGDRNRVRRVDDDAAHPNAGSGAGATKTVSRKTTSHTGHSSKKEKAVPTATPAVLGDFPENMHIAIPAEFINSAVASLKKRQMEAAKLAGEAVGGLGDATDTSRDANLSPLTAADVYAIMIGGGDPALLSTQDAEKKLDVVGHLGVAFSAASVAAKAFLTPGVVASEWPKDETYAAYALKGVRANVEARVRKEMSDGGEKEEGEGQGQDVETKVDAAMRSLPWIDHFTKRADDGSLKRDDHWPENFDHHVGCLFAHMLVWQLAKDKAVANLGDTKDGELTTPTSVIFESDGAASANLAVPFTSLQFAIQSAPSDFDILFVNKLEDPAIDTRFPWGSNRVDTKVDEVNQVSIDFFRYRNPYAAGISGYVIGPAFVEKIQNRIATHGADMVDAWLYKLCGDQVGDEIEKTVLKCYAAVDREIVDRVRRERPEGT